MKAYTPSPATLGSFLKEQGRQISDTACEQLACYLDMLMRWNKSMNLVGTRTWKDTCLNLVCDSFELAAFLERLPLSAEPVTWDFGSGAGLPGIPLRMLWKKGSYTLVEARAKRVLFMRQVLGLLKLPETQVFEGRAEAFMEKTAPCELLVSRAFMPWEKLLHFAESGIRQGGMAVFMLNESLAGQTLPAGWSPGPVSQYRVSGGERFLCALLHSGTPLTDAGDRA